MKNTHRSIMDKARQRSTGELFRTPAASYKALFRDFPKLIEGDCLDPSAGDGRYISAILEGRNRNKHAIYDIRKMEYVNWKKVGLVKSLGRDNCLIVPDWLQEKRPRLFDSVITNPPFSLACEIVQQGLQWVRPGGYVTVLHRLNWLGTAKRSVWQQSMPLRHVIVISSRPVFELDGRDKNIADTYEYAFFAYRLGYKGTPTVKWLPN